MELFTKGPDSKIGPAGSFVDIAAQIHKRKAEQKTEDMTRGIISSVLQALGEVSDVNGGGEKLAQNTINPNDINISGDSEIIIPEGFGYDFPLVFFLKEKESLSLSEVLKMNGGQRKAITEAIAGQEIQIRVGDKVLNIDLDTRCSINGTEGSLRQYILSPHQISLQEIA